MGIGRVWGLRQWPGADRADLKPPDDTPGVAAGRHGLTRRF
ncbi:hypothetical protein I545_2496 [Mycobacterium kansasii 662]|nr:hypothetical protein I547_4412 [Mycobacterium kansasii 824]EUA18614.1 hypothetical protein I545_2496 [Mycobacterium kansasii 662]KEP39110.1 hypothetical protein MKSMC1_57500 [Mycobacterium kansasii]